MKTVLFVLLCIGSNLANAQTPPPAPANEAPSVVSGQHFEAAKAKRLARIAARLTTLQQLQACVQAASNSRQMRACHMPLK